jgi:hypothetical protein
VSSVTAVGRADGTDWVTVAVVAPRASPPGTITEAAQIAPVRNDTETEGPHQRLRDIGRASAIIGLEDNARR